jgi:hypothetical protein
MEFVGVGCAILLIIMLLIPLHTSQTHQNNLLYSILLCLIAFIILEIIPIWDVRYISYTLKQNHPKLLDPDKYAKDYRNRFKRINISHIFDLDPLEIAKLLKDLYNLDSESYNKITNLSNDDIEDLYKIHLVLKNLHKDGVNISQLEPDNLIIRDGYAICKSRISVDRFYKIIGKDRIIQAFSNAKDNASFK